MKVVDEGCLADEPFPVVIFFSFPSYISGFHHLGEIFAYVTEVATFRLRGWCMLGVFLLLVFSRLGQECQDLWSPCDGMHVCYD